MPAALIAWLTSHQAIAAALAAWFAMGAAGVDLTSKAIDLERKIEAPAKPAE